MKLVAFAVIGILLLAVTVLVTPAHAITLGPILNVPPSVNPGGTLIGDAEEGSHIVEVEATLPDGSQLPGSPDGDMEGDMNIFFFNIPPNLHNVDIRVKAVDEYGMVREKWVHVD